PKRFLLRMDGSLALGVGPLWQMVRDSYSWNWGRSLLHCPAPPSGGLDAQEPGLVAAGKVKVHHLVLFEGGAIGPAIVFFQVGGFLVIIDQGDLGLRALDDALRLEGEGGSRRRSRRHLVCDLGEQQ